MASKAKEIEVKFYTRNEHQNNSTHDNIVDQSIVKATLWKTDSFKHILSLLCYTFSLGTLYICTLLWPNLLITFSCIPSDIKEAEFIVITDTLGEKHVIMIIKEDYNNIKEDADIKEIKACLYFPDRKTKNDSLIEEASHLQSLSACPSPHSQLDETKIIKEPLPNSVFQREGINEKIVIYMLNKYRYDYTNDRFAPIDMDLSTYKLSQLHQMKNGIPSDNIYQYLQSYYPKNEISVKDHGTFGMICLTSCNFFNLFSLYCIAIWAWDGYWEFSIIVATFNIAIIIFSVVSWNSNLKSIINFDNKNKVDLLRKFIENKVPLSSKNIVPGDIILLKKSNKSKTDIIVPCDGLLLSGYCTVNESDLTGENTLVLKKELLNSDDYFKYKRVKHSFLYQGTRISLLFSREKPLENEDNMIYLLATNTGYNTYRGDMIQNWNLKKPTQETMNVDQKFYCKLMMIVWLIAIIPLVFLYKEKKFPISNLILEILDFLTVIVPPALPITISMATFYFNFILKRKDISCVIEKKMNAAGLIKRIVLDKTGTLTQSQFDIHCFRTTKYDNDGKLVLDSKPVSPSILNKTYKLFWKKVYKEYKNIDSSYQISYRNNMIYFVECLASCHEVYKISNETIGKTIDQKIFKQIKWEMHQSDRNNINSDMKIEPHNAYKITENMDYNGDTSTDSPANAKGKTDINVISQRKSNAKTINNGDITMKFPNNHTFGRGSSQENDVTTFANNNNKNFANNNNSSNNNNNDNDIIDNNLSDNNSEKIESDNDSISNSITDNNNDLFNNTPEPHFYLTYLKRYEFSSQSQSMSVVVRNSIDHSLRLYIKGAPEKIKSCCNNDSIPYNLEEQLHQYTNEGYRVFACATRILSFKWNKNDPVDTYQKGLTFLGLIIFSNLVKKDTKEYINHLIESNCKITIATGDNVFTSISVAEQCEIIKKDANIYRLEICEENDKRTAIVHAVGTKKAKEDKGNEQDKDREDKEDKDKDDESNAKSTEQLEEITKDNSTQYEKLLKRIQDDEKAIICASGNALNIILSKRKEYIDYERQSKNNNKSKRNSNILNGNHSNISGTTNDNIFNKDKYNNALLINLIKLKGVIFFRMLPADKSTLISLYQEDKSGLVAMCGDGANDCKALMTADVGVAINQSNNNNLICHFSSKKESIECLELIIRNGRAFFENNILIFKFLLVYSAIQETTVIYLNCINRDLNNIQLLYLDCLCVLIPLILAASTQAASKLSDKAQQKLKDPTFIISSIAQLIIHIGGQLSYCVFITPRAGIDEVKESTIVDANADADKIAKDDDLKILNSYIYMMSLFQIIFCLFIFNCFSLQRKKYYNNKRYMIFFAVIVYLCICSFTSKEFFNIFGVIAIFEDDGEYEMILETNQFLTIVWLCGIVLMSLGVEMIIYYCWTSQRDEDGDEEMKQKERKKHSDALIAK